MLKLHDTGPEVVDLHVDLVRVGFGVTSGYPTTFNALTEACVKAFQLDHRLPVDGIVGPVTHAYLDAAPTLNLAAPDTTERARRLSRALLTLWDGDRFRMRPEYRSSSVDAWRAMQAGDRREYVVPLACDGSGKHGATCGHAAWILTEWYYRGIGPGRAPTWRTGRGPGGDPFRSRFLPLLPAAGGFIEESLHRGLSEYAGPSFRVDDLRDIYDASPALAADNPGDWYYCQRDSGHVVLVIVARPGAGFADPRTGLPARLGAYRLAADGSKRTLGQPWTWKRIEADDVGEWTVWEMQRLRENGRPDGGPCAEHPDLPLVLE